MNTEFYIIDGYLKVLKGAFVQELLSADSVFKKLLQWESTGDFIKNHPMISEEDGYIEISFNKVGVISIWKSPIEIFKELKSKYKGGLKGELDCKGIYLTFRTEFFFRLALDSDTE